MQLELAGLARGKRGHSVPISAHHHSLRDPIRLMHHMDVETRLLVEETRPAAESPSPTDKCEWCRVMGSVKTSTSTGAERAGTSPPNFTGSGSLCDPFTVSVLCPSC